jgi:protein-S-isoprenylcysteine O-methyltransferase Ste14
VETRRLFPPAYLLITLCMMLGLHFLSPVAIVIPPPWILAGLLPLLAGILLNLHGAGLFQSAGTTIQPFAPSQVLVMQGAYRISRNPMYLGFALVLLGVAILLGTLAPFITIPIFILLIQQRFIRAEERMLAERFGAVYTAYRQRVRRWL